jgi:hypothetical protein
MEAKVYTSGSYGLHKWKVRCVEVETKAYTVETTKVYKIGS